MKFKNLKKYKNKILQLNLVKLKSYKKKQYTNINFDSKKIELQLKKILYIIYEYHVNKKKILFLEFPKSFKHILKNTKHVLIPNNILDTSILNNGINLNNSNILLKNKKISLNIIKILLQLNKRIDLIVVYHSSNIFITSTIVNYKYKSKIPLICCLNEFNKLDSKITYKILTTNKFINEKIFNNNFIYTMIKTALKKAVNFRINRNKPNQKI